MILGARLGSVSSQLGGTSWHLFVTTTADPGIIDLVGRYAPVILATGEYRTTFDFVGQYENAIDLFGEVE